MSKYIKNMVVMCNEGKEYSTVKEGWHNDVNSCMLKISKGLTICTLPETIGIQIVYFFPCVSRVLRTP
jgi:hypothetical protein